MLDLMINSSVTHSLLLVIPILMALILRWARCPGWAVLGGVLGGLLLGPALLGRIAPNMFEDGFVGGFEQRAARDAIVRRQEADLFAARTSGVDPAGIAELRAAHRPERLAAERAWEAETWRFQRPFRSYTAAVAVIVLLGAGRLRLREQDRLGGPISPVSIGAWSAALPGAAAVLATMAWFGHPVTGAVIAGAAVAIGPWVLTRTDQVVADRVELRGAMLVQAAGRVASVVAIAAAAWALTRAMGLAGLVATAPLLAVPLGWMLPAWGVDRIVREVLVTAFVPSLAACAALRLDPAGDFAIWPLIVFVILSGDGRWLGAVIGTLLPGGRGGLGAMRLALGAMACGPTQLAITAIALHHRAVPGPIAFALVLGAVVVEVSAPMRRWTARQLEEEG
ncbi:MAG: hypothetical protein GY715_20895 [Planctomycetes bacterium]|nr:hypothetical protein [Planctomycetota bacterium]